MKKIILLTATLLIFLSYGQTLTNQVSIGGVDYEFMNIYNSPDGNGYYLIGYSNSNISGYKSENSKGASDIWIVKIDNNFNKEWDKTIGGSSYEAIDIGGVLIYEDGIYIVSESMSNISGDKNVVYYGSYDIWILNLDLEGNILWQNGYGGDASEREPNILNYTDTSLVISSFSLSDMSGNKTLPYIGLGTEPYTLWDFWILEVNKENGNIIKQKVYGTALMDVDIKIFKNPYNNHIYFCSTAFLGVSGDKTEIGYGVGDAWLVELDENLDIIQQKVFGGSENEIPWSLIFTEDAIYFVVESYSNENTGNKTSPHYGFAGNSDIWLLKLNYDFSIVWDKSYGGNLNEDLWSDGFLFLPNGNISLSIYSNSPEGTGNKTAVSFDDPYDPNDPYSIGDIWSIVIEPVNGDIVYETTFGGSKSENGGIIKGNNDDYILWAISDSPASGNKTVNTLGDLDLWLAKINMSEILNLSSLKEQNFSVYPNPVNNTLFISGEINNNASFQITDLLGNIVKIDNFSNESSLQQIDVSELNLGMYILLIDNFRMKFLKN